MKKRKRKRFPLFKKIGYLFLTVYAVTAVFLTVFLMKLNMIPVTYLAVLGGALFFWGLFVLVMQKTKVTSIIADILCLILAVCSVAGCIYLDKTVATLRHVSTVTGETDEIGVYVLSEDSAEELFDVIDYRFGRVASVDKENTDQTISDMNAELEKELELQEYSDVFSMLSGLKNGEIGAVVINSAYISIVKDSEAYSWVEEGLRQIASYTHEVEEEVISEADIPEDGSNSFIMYMSGIDTYGGVSTRSRSDVNILAIVNTETKNILLLSTPRDYYVAYSVTGGVKDKLTHAGIYGVDASMDALEQLYGIDINYYLRVNFTGFTQIIDALGGVDVYSDYEFTARGTQIYQGYNSLNGEQALSFARERYSFQDGDFQRGRNQMEVIKAVIQKVASSSMLANYMDVMNAVAGSFETNMPQETIADLVKKQLGDMTSWNITSYTAQGSVSSAETFSAPGEMLSVVIPNESSVEEAKHMIANVIQP